MKPRRDDDFDIPWYLGVGAVHGVGEDGEERERPAGTIYLPDPEERRGVRAYFVPKAREGKPGRRPIGFGRSGT